MRALRFVASCLLLAACDGIAPEVGAELDLGAVTDADGGTGGVPGTGTCGVHDSDPSRKVTWSDVRSKVLEKRCGCHMTPSGFGATVGGLLLERRDTALKGGRHGKWAIVPGDPCKSFVVQKTGTSPPFGARMPLQASPLSGPDRQLLIDWIAEGAQP